MTIESSITSSAPGPIAARSRIQALDTLRGFALLGILVMNITGMAFQPLVARPSNSALLNGSGDRSPIGSVSRFGL